MLTAMVRIGFRCAFGGVPAVKVLADLPGTFSAVRRCEPLSPCNVSIVAILLHYLSIGANCHLT